MNRRVRLIARLGRMWSPSDEYGLKQDVIASLHLAKASCSEQSKQSRDRYSVVASSENLGVADSAGLFGNQIHAEVVLIGLPLPNLNRQETVVTVIAQAIRPNIWILTFNRLVVADRKDYDTVGPETSVDGPKSLQDFLIG